MDVGGRQVGTLLHGVPSSVLLCLEAVVTLGSVRSEVVQGLFKGFGVEDLLRCEMTFLHRHDVRLLVEVLLEEVLFDPLSDRELSAEREDDVFCALGIAVSRSPGCLAVS